jgi:uncharacterized protein with PIN domain
MSPADGNPRVACDACCGGLARWLRLLGVDTTYTHGIDDGDLVRHALAEQRLVISCDRRLFLRRVFTHGQLAGLFVPVGLRRRAQVRFVLAALDLQPTEPRCTRCNGVLRAVPRAAVADRVPSRTLTWLSDYYVCSACDHVFWKGTHWDRITATLAGPADDPSSLP